MLDSRRFDFGAMSFGSGLAYGTGGGGSSSSPADDGDIDDDGIPDAEDDEDNRPIIVIADRDQIRDTQALEQLANQQATGILFSLAVFAGTSRVASEAVMAFLTRMFGSQAVAGGVAAGAGFVAQDVAHEEIANLLFQIHLNDWEADGRNIEMPQRGDWDYVGDPFARP